MAEKGLCGGGSQGSGTLEMACRRTVNGAHAGLAAGLFSCLTMQLKPRRVAMHGRGALIRGPRGAGTRRRSPLWAKPAGAASFPYNSVCRLSPQGKVP
jgi:hypothetical protein